MKNLPLLLNLLVFPGTGTILAKRKIQGSLQILATTIALAWLATLLITQTIKILEFYQNFNNHLQTNNTQIINHQIMNQNLIPPIALLTISYLWALLTSKPKTPKKIQT